MFQEKYGWKYGREFGWGLSFGTLPSAINDEQSNPTPITAEVYISSEIVEKPKLSQFCDIL